MKRLAVALIVLAWIVLVGHPLADSIDAYLSARTFDLKEWNRQNELDQKEKLRAELKDDMRKRFGGCPESERELRTCILARMKDNDHSRDR